MNLDRRLLLLAMGLGLVVVMLGAYTRLSDAGLGCPDWPGCYGRLTVPAEVSGADPAYLRQRALEPGKAWKEMIHRYAAGTLGLLILVLAVRAWWPRDRRGGEARHRPAPLAATLLLMLVVFQALLGMWTVTLQLKPVVVMGHLLGGLATLGMVTWLWLRTGPGAALAARPPAPLRAWGLLALGVVVVQIALGGWTSANYAALACTDFPTCHGRWWPEADFREAFVLWRGLGINYEYGVLDHPARTAIHLAHRLGALAVLLAVGSLGLLLLRREPAPLRRAGALVLVLLATQIALGITNVLAHLPLPVAVAHNGVAALLLLSLLLTNHRLWPRSP